MANGNFGGGDGSIGNPYKIEDMLDLLAGSLLEVNKTTTHFQIVNNIDASEYISNPDFITFEYNKYKIVYGNNNTIDFGNIQLFKKVFKIQNIYNLNFINIRQCDDCFISGVYELTSTNINNCKFYIDTSEYKKYNSDHTGYILIFGRLTNDDLYIAQFNNCYINLKCYGKDTNAAFRVRYVPLSSDLGTLGGSYYRCKIELDIKLEYIVDRGIIRSDLYYIDIAADLNKECFVVGNVYTYITYKYNKTPGYAYYIHFTLNLPTLYFNSYSMLNVSAGFNVDFKEIGNHVDLVDASIRVHNRQKCYDSSTYRFDIPNIPDWKPGRSSFTIELEAFGNTSAGSDGGYSYATADFITSNLIDRLTIKSGPGLVPDSYLKDKDTFMNWDFENIWGISPNINGGYPYLRWYNYSEDNLFIMTPKGILNIPFYSRDDTLDKYVLFKNTSEIKFIKLVSPNSPDALPIRIMTPKGIMSFSK